MLQFTKDDENRRRCCEKEQRDKSESAVLSVSDSTFCEEADDRPVIIRILFLKSISK